MKIQLFGLAALLASSPAAASVDASDDVTRLGLAALPAAYTSATEPAVTSPCGQETRMLFILRDPSGAIVAIGVAAAPAVC